jgi:hypothetical protein
VGTLVAAAAGILLPHLNQTCRLLLHHRNGGRRSPARQKVEKVGALLLLLLLLLLGSVHSHHLQQMGLVDSMLTPPQLLRQVNLSVDSVLIVL